MLFPKYTGTVNIAGASHWDAHGLDKHHGEMGAGPRGSVGMDCGGQSGYTGTEALHSTLGHEASLGSSSRAEFTPFLQGAATSTCCGKRENTMKELQGVRAMLSVLPGVCSIPTSKPMSQPLGETHHAGKPLL